MAALRKAEELEKAVRDAEIEHARIENKISEHGTMTEQIAMTEAEAAEAVAAGQFVPAPSFDGAKAGYDSKGGDFGLGYYRTEMPVAMAPVAVAGNSAKVVPFTQPALLLVRLWWRFTVSRG